MYGTSLKCIECGLIWPSYWRECVVCCRSSHVVSSKRKAILMIPSNQPNGDDDNISVQPSTVNRLYQPAPYSLTHHPSTPSIIHSGTLPPSGDLDSYCTPHYGCYATSPSGNYFTTYCRSHSADVWASRSTSHQPENNIVSRSLAAGQETTDDANVNTTSVGLSTILTLTTGNGVSGCEKIYGIGESCYQSSVRTPDTNIFPVFVASGIGSCVERSSYVVWSSYWFEAHRIEYL